RHADERAGAHRRHRPHRPVGLRRHALPPSAHRLRVPGVQPRRPPHGRRERPAPAAARRAPPGPEVAGHVARVRRAGGHGRPPAARAVRRAGAARGDRPRARHAADRRLRRRAHRRPRPPHRRPGARRAPRHRQAARPDAGRRDARPVRGRRRRRRALPRRRPARRRARRADHRPGRRPPRRAGAVTTMWSFARSAVRANPASFAGSFLVVVAAAALLAANGVLMESGLRADAPMLTTVAGSFAGTAVLVVALVVASTFAAALRRRTEQYALLRAVGATPAQVRSMLTEEVGLVSAVAAPVGAVPGLFAALRFTPLPASGGIVPAGLVLVVTPLS